jgi:hypothetical protein
MTVYEQEERDNGGYISPLSPVIVYIATQIEGGKPYESSGKLNPTGAQAFTW